MSPRRSIAGALTLAALLGALTPAAEAQEPAEGPEADAAPSDAAVSDAAESEAAVSDAAVSEVPASEAAVPVGPSSPTEVVVPAGYGHARDLATPRRAVPVDDERPPAFRAHVTTAPRAPAEPVVLDGHTMPIRVADRPLTLTAGTMRIDQGILLRTASGILARMTVAVTMGATEDFEIGLSWPIEGDPTLAATGRLYRDDVFELGLRGALMAPVVTTGNTNARIGLPILIHGGPVRFFAAVELDLLFTANVSALVAVPAQLSITAGRAFSFGAQGWIGVVDWRFPQGDVLGFVNFTAHNGRRALMDVRFALGYAPAEQDVIFTHSLSFYPQLF